MELAADGLSCPLVEGDAIFRAGFDEIAGRPAVTAGGFAPDRAAAGSMKDQTTGIGLASCVDDEAVLVALDPGEVARVVVSEDAHGGPDIREGEYER